MNSQAFSNILAKCFLCRKKCTQQRMQRIDQAKCPVSSKSIKDILQHLSRLSNTELFIAQNEHLCRHCHAQLLEYDATMMKAVAKQRSLTQLIEKAAEHIVDSDDYDEDEMLQHMQQLEQEQHLSESVYVSDSEINETINAAMGIASNKTPASTMVSGKPKRWLEAVTLQCNLCAMRFRSKIRLSRHVTQAHKKFSCQQCNYSHRNEDYVRLHMNLHEGRNENQCRFCYKEFATKISTIRHMEVHLESKKYQCDKCGLCFSQTTVLYNHKLQHEAEEQPLRCDICNQMFKTKRTYRHHLMTHKPDRPRYSCEICGKTFTEKYTLKMHKRIHPATTTNEQPMQTEVLVDVPQQQQQQQLPHNEMDNKFNCIICEHVFSVKDQLNKHMEKEHDVILKSINVSNCTQYIISYDEPRKSCQICGHMFNTQSNLDSHLEEVHGALLK